MGLTNEKVVKILRDCSRQLHARRRARPSSTALHDFRVATRKLQAALLALEGLHKRRVRAWRHRVSSFRQKSNRVRDQEVLAGILRGVLSPAEFKAWSNRQPRPSLDIPSAIDLRRVLSAIKREFIPVLRACKQREVRQAVRNTLQKQSARLQRLSLKAQKKGLTQKWIHPTRIQAKKLRYELALWGWLSSASRKSLEKNMTLLKQTQDCLGELHDLDVAMETIRKDPKWPEREERVREKALARLSKNRRKISRSGLALVKKLSKYPLID